MWWVVGWGDALDRVIPSQGGDHPWPFARASPKKAGPENGSLQISSPMAPPLEPLANSLPPAARSPTRLPPTLFDSPRTYAEHRHRRDDDGQGIQAPPGQGPSVASGGLCGRATPVLELSLDHNGGRDGIPARAMTLTDADAREEASGALGSPSPHALSVHISSLPLDLCLFFCDSTRFVPPLNN